MKKTVKNRLVRYSVMTVILGLTIYLALGFGKRSFEAFCPFGGMESLWGLFTTQQFSCALGPLNLSMMIGVLSLDFAAFDYYILIILVFYNKKQYV